MEDLRPWKENALLNASSILDLFAQLRKMAYLPAVHQLVVTYRNRIYFPEREDPQGIGAPEMWDPHLKAWERVVSQGAWQGDIQLPDSVFVINVEDNAPRWCRRARNCSAPLFSLAKTVDGAADSDTDLLVPQMMWLPSASFLVPWELKQDRAFFRGQPYCNDWFWVKQKYKYADACSRRYLAYRSMMDERAGNGTVLDVGLSHKPYRAPRQPDGSVHPDLCVREDIPVAGPVTVANHSQYKWLLHLDGITASYRLSQLFHINSVVLRQRSPFIEFFYRSLRDGEHCIPFWNDSSSDSMDDIYAVVARARQADAADPLWAHRIIRSAHEFAMQFLTPLARLRYVARALLEYNKLFDGMQALLQQQLGAMRARGFPLEDAPP